MFYQMPIKRLPEFSDPAWSLIEGLLNRDPSQRLGGSKEDALEIMSHPFFTGLNWSHLINKQLKPPFVPEISNLELDYGKYIEPDFLNHSISLVAEGQQEENSLSFTSNLSPKG